MDLQPWSVDTEAYVFLRPESECGFPILPRAGPGRRRKMEDSFNWKFAHLPAVITESARPMVLCNKASLQLAKCGLPPS